MNGKESGGVGFLIGLAAGTMLLAGAALFVFVIPTVPNPWVLPGDHPIPKLTLLEKWNADHYVRDLIRQNQILNQQQKAEAEKRGTVCFDP
jgi:hypothetical protein